MRSPTRLIAAVMSVIVLSTALAGCGQTVSSTPSAMCLATDFPSSGPDAAAGLAAQNAVDLAVDQASLSGGYTLTTVHYHSSSAAQGRANLTDAASQSCMRGYIGPDDASIAAAQIPIATNAGLPMLAPGLTNPGLTNANDAQYFGFDSSVLHPSGKQDAFFRLLPTDDLQAAAAASALVQGGSTHIYVVDDSTPYGQSVAAFFVAALRTQTATIVGRASTALSASSQVFATVSNIRDAAADGVFYAGSTAGAIALRQAPSLQVPLAIMTTPPVDPAYIQAAEPAAEGTLTVSALPDVASLQSTQAAQFVSAYTQRFGSAPTPLAVSAYDAAEIVIGTIRKIIAAGNIPYLASVLDQVSTQQYTGIAGSYWFTTAGDNALAATPQLYVVRSANWQPLP